MVPRDLVERQQKDHTLWRLVNQPICPQMIDYVSKVASETIWCNPNLDNANAFSGDIPTLYVFIARLAQVARVPTLTFLSTVVYLTRLKARLSTLEFYGSRCTGHRIFLSTFILASKYIDDVGPQNRVWKRYCNMRDIGYSFSLSSSEITFMELQTLGLLEWDLSISVEDLNLILAFKRIETIPGLDLRFQTATRTLPNRRAIRKSISQLRSSNEDSEVISMIEYGSMGTFAKNVEKHYKHRFRRVLTELVSSLGSC